MTEVMPRAGTDRSQRVEQECFGSAGCNVRFRVELAYLHHEPLDPTGTCEVTYETEGKKCSSTR